MNKLIITATIALAALTASAQNYQLPDRHASQHQGLLANQGNASISVENTTQFMEALFNEEEEPEFDIYTEGWDSKRVNCYSEANVPSSAVIDVSNFSMPHPGYITSPYGYRRRFRRMHKGVDLKVNIGDTVRAAFDGRVRITNFERRGYGNYVVLRHTNDLETVYGHLSAFIVKDGDYVKAGDPIALAGNTGRSTGPHLHFETRYMGYAINPCAIFDFANQTTHTDTYTFSKSTYQNARNYDPKANSQYAQEYLKKNPSKPYVRSTASSGSSSKGGSSSYRVRKGDSLSKIAARNGTTVAKLCKLNKITANSKLQIGQRLRVR
ncbi:MAG: peptidoglycan DD-metalloendopeptidase family protein [Muribaculaceae bacterium]|nr:peptidoglycan DD-metalloendopeptidase family protein [Bacteroidales bacterium]MDE6041292.1 peptidoglycan DD-metalloendopeptidase family protein [Muribaculaceae bacterium]